MRIEYSARSHMGRVRKNNEDNLFANQITLPEGLENRPFAIDGIADLPAVFAVCDGMGGEEHGEIASRIAVNTLTLHYESFCHATERQIANEVAAYVNNTHEAICESVGRDVRTGATLALSIIMNRGAFCFNLGDSRIYAIRKGRLQKITHDHTWIAEQQAKGIQLSMEDIRANQHKITRCIGTGESQSAEEYHLIGGKCRFLLCSDGLTDMVSDAEIEGILYHCTSTVKAADTLISRALHYGGKDNTTLIVVDTGKSHIFPFL